MCEFEWGERKFIIIQWKLVKEIHRNVIDCFYRWRWPYPILFVIDALYHDAVSFQNIIPYYDAVSYDEAVLHHDIVPYYNAVPLQVQSYMPIKLCLAAWLTKVFFMTYVQCHRMSLHWQMILSNACPTLCTVTDIDRLMFVDMMSHNVWLQICLG